MNNKKLLDRIAEITGEQPVLDLELLNDFLNRCIVTDIGSAVSSQLLFIAFQAYVIVRGAQAVTKPAEFKRKVKPLLGWSEGDRASSEIENLRIVWKNIEIDKKESDEKV